MFGKKTYFLMICCLLLLVKNLGAAISLSSLSDFEDGTLQGWGNVTSVDSTSGGPAGAGDNFLQVVSNGTLGSGGKLVFLNTGSDWTGNWTTAGVTYIRFQFNNINGEVLFRILN